jgi:outer membrane biosynthesis protein TonB
MRKFILIAAIAFASVSAQAGESRNLTLAAGDEPTAVEQSRPVETPKAVETTKAVEETKPAETPKFVDRPAPVNTATETPKTETAKPVTAKAEKPKHRHYWTEARIIGELHRHGIYW